MKKLFFIVSVVVAFSACKKKDSNSTSSPSNNNSASTVITQTTSSTAKTVLLEIYTGHTCTNAASADSKARSLYSTFGDRLIIINNHVTNAFAFPISDTLYKEDFRNSTSTDWDNAMLMSVSPGLPSSAVNRIQPYAMDPILDMGAAVIKELALPQTAKLDVTSIYNTAKSTVQVKVKTTFLTASPKNINLVVVLAVDSIEGDQKDHLNGPGTANLSPEGVIIRNYIFNHVVIGSINGSWGQLVKSAPAANDEVTITTSEFSIANTCFYKSTECLKNMDKHISVIAFICDIDTKEVLQVEKLKIR